jgi:hypothetical protein
VDALESTIVGGSLASDGKALLLYAETVADSDEKLRQLVDSLPSLEYLNELT